MCLAAIGDAVRFLLARQSPDGAWRDFALPVGAACCWTTAYTLPRVAAAAALVGCDIRPALRAAAEHLRRHATPHGWGYNTACPADADSTAHALLALPDAHPRHAAALARFFLREGGVRTYRWPPPGHGWGAAHPEVTATAVRALRGWLPSDHALLRAGLAWLATGRAAYWWDAPHYLPLELLRLGLPVADWPPTAPSAFDEALALECTILRGDPARVDPLLALRLADGSWPCAPILRLPGPAGSFMQRFADERRVFTTATALSALVRATGSGDGAAAVGRSGLTWLV
jgi:hypothetical protein